MVRLKEQASCPVDDLVLVEPRRTHFHQLKTSPEITWTADGGKLEKEFREQDRQCREAGGDYALVLVVAQDRRADLLRDAMPGDLRDATTVLHFPMLDKPSHLAGLRELLGGSFDSLRATRFASRTADQAIAGAFFLAFAEHEPDGDGYCVLAHVLHAIRDRWLADVRQRLPIAHPRWPEAEKHLAGVEGLEWWTDRGYFEWQYRRADAGLVGPVPGESFHRFVDRIVSQPPKTLEDFEGLLP